MNAYDVLQEAHKLVSKGWCKELAKNARGQVCGPGGEYVENPKNAKEQLFVPAVAWSLVGAINAAENSQYGFFKTDAYKFAQKALADLGYRYNYLADFNDPDKSKGKTTREDVLQVLEEALELASK